MGCASKLLMLLTSPFPFRPSALRLTRLTTAFSSSYPKRTLSSSSSRPLLRFPFTSKHLHTHSVRVTREDFHSDPSPAFPPNNPTFSHPWPEWSKLVDCLRGSGYFDRQVVLDGEDALSVFENLPDEFLQAAGACLAFARRRNDLLGSLSRRDIENVVGNGSPLLFKSVTDSARKMKSFLGIGPGNELEFERAQTVDLMRFLLSYAYNPSGVSNGNNLGNGQLVESSVRNLLSEIADASRVDQEFEISHSTPRQFSDGYGQTTRPPRQNIEMKRGDWICPKCSFMNFARNMKCLECSEARPKRQLTGGEWECPQCNFFNYGRNVSCLRCDCRRPGDASFGTSETRPGMGYSKESNLNKVGMANTSAAPLEQRFACTPLQGNLESDGTLPGNNGPSYSRSTAAPMTQNLDRILGRSSSASETNYNLTAAGENNTRNEKSSFSSSTSPQFRRSEGNKSDYVPFVPLPADMFAKPHNSSEEKQITSNNPAEVKRSVFGKSGDSFSLSEKQVNQSQSEEDKEQAEKSERWFKKVSELHDVPDLTSAISDEDFPEIMPMRKGENRFVVSKKKDRSLTSPLHKRRMAMEQTNTTNFVPFVPFPPDYFAKKDKEPDTGSASTTPEMQGVPEKLDENKFGVPNTGTISTSPQSTNSRQATDSNWNTTFSGKSVNENKIDYGYVGNSTQRPNDIGTSNGESGNSNSLKDNRSDGGNTSRSTTQQLDNNQSSRESYGGFTGKSLEGSLVKEPDPLDMSEEAKAERWFRRAAQIKDISELSQIPDEDFPSIMPMRKGVNRFVVSKRKTPMERRLTSPQYRRNLPIVSSEPIKKENNDS